MTHHTLYTSLIAALLCLGACKTAAPKEEIAEAPKEEKAIKAEASTPMAAAIYAAMACPAESITASGCEVCPHGLANPSQDATSIDITQGTFSATATRSVLAEFTGCGSTDEELNAKRLTMLEQDAQGAWRVATRYALPNPQKPCVIVPGPAGASQSICTSSIENPGSRSTYYELINWASPVPDTTGPSATSIVLLEVAHAANCEQNASVMHDVIIQDPADHNADGTPDITLTIATTTGPFKGDLSTCPTDTAPPERTPTTTTSTYIYHQTSDGPVEHKGQGSYLSPGQEFEDLMGP